MLKLYNTLSKKVEEFKPQDPNNVSLYICGPTVYDFIHIGNLRAFIIGDILHRVLRANNYQVKFVQNITDIDDKIIKKAKEQNLSIQEITEKYTKFFFEDLIKLNILPADVYPKATEHIDGMIKYTKKLIEKGYAYVEKDGSVYFDISKYPNYGKLSGVQKRELKTGTRILSDEYSKDDVLDFALWKSVETQEFGFDSPWGKGRPGWHIECSVMSQKLLGETIDIHGGGIDLIFPHHENEIAQSEAYTGKPFVNYFVHGEHILVNNQKMSKSLKNFYTLADLEEKGFDPLALRYLFLTAHYRDKQNFTWEALEAAQNALDNLRERIRALDEPKDETGEYWQKFLEAANNDLNMPQAVAVLQQMLNTQYTTYSMSRDLLEMDKILGLELDKYLAKPIEIPDEVQKLVDQREEARQNKDFEKSDEIRKQIKNLGFEIDDTEAGPKIK